MDLKNDSLWNRKKMNLSKRNRITIIDTIKTTQGDLKISLSGS